MSDNDIATTIAQVSLLTGARHGAPPPCAGCGERIDVATEYYLCWAGDAARPTMLAAAHPARWVGPGPGDDDYDEGCAAALRQLWDDALTDAGTAHLVLGCDGRGRRFFLAGEALHAGTPIDVATAGGTWLSGRVEYTTGETSAPMFYFALAGWNGPQVGVTLMPDAVVRLG